MRNAENSINGISDSLRWLDQNPFCYLGIGVLGIVSIEITWSTIVVLTIIVVEDALLTADKDLLLILLSSYRVYAGW